MTKDEYYKIQDILETLDGLYDLRASFLEDDIDIAVIEIWRKTKTHFSWTLSEKRIKAFIIIINQKIDELNEELRELGFY